MLYDTKSFEILKKKKKKIIIIIFFLIERDLATKQQPFKVQYWYWCVSLRAYLTWDWQFAGVSIISHYDMTYYNNTSLPGWWFPHYQPPSPPSQRASWHLSVYKAQKKNRETITWNFSAVYWSHRPKKKPFQHLKFDHFHTGSLQWNMIRVKDFWDKTPTRYKIKLFVSRPQFDVSEVES